MGYWCTLHLFDDQKFYSEVIPKMKGERGDLSEDYLEFLKYHTTGGIAHLSEEKIKSQILKQKDYNKNISNSFDKLFKTHLEFNESKDNDPFEFTRRIKGYEEFCWFLQYYVFKYCSDFYPQILLGKGGVMRNFQLNKKSLAYSIINELDNWNGFVYCDMMGITNWLTSEEVELLYLDRANLNFEDSLTAEGFVNLLEVAYQNKLGLIAGVDMREWMLELLPKNKLIDPKIWGSLNTKGICFDIHKAMPR
jgi:hypothetical protein